MTQILQATLSGEEHGLVATYTNSCEFNDFKHMAPHIKAKLEKEKKEDARVVKVKYVNLKGSHNRLDKVYCKYAGEPLLKYHLIPNRVYDVPYGMVKEVNEIKAVRRSGLVSLDGEKLNSDGSPIDKDMSADQEHMLVPATF